MREVFTSPDVTEVGYYKSLLDEAGIPSFIRNENASTIGMAGALFFPSLCIVDDTAYDEAIRLLKSKQAPREISGADWTCPQCSETNPGNFETCWKCNALRPGAAPSTAGA